LGDEAVLLRSRTGCALTWISGREVLLLPFFGGAEGCERWLELKEGNICFRPFQTPFEDVLLTSAMATVFSCKAGCLLEFGLEGTNQFHQRFALDGINSNLEPKDNFISYLFKVIDQMYGVPVSQRLILQCLCCTHTHFWPPQQS